jgi:hypothetical protein
LPQRVALRATNWSPNRHSQLSFHSAARCTASQPAARSALSSWLCSHLYSELILPHSTAFCPTPSSIWPPESFLLFKSKVRFFLNKPRCENRYASCAISCTTGYSSKASQTAAQSEPWRSPVRELRSSMRKTHEKTRPQKLSYADDTLCPRGPGRRSWGRTFGPTAGDAPASSAAELVAELFSSRAQVQRTCVRH